MQVTALLFEVFQVICGQYFILFVFLKSKQEGICYLFNWAEFK